MTIETDEQAYMRAGLDDSGSLQWDKAVRNTDIFDLGVLQNKTENVPIIPHSIFFSYMRFNKDGTFHSTNWYHEGDKEQIDPSADPNERNSLGYYIRDMALHARSKRQSDLQYTYVGKHLEGIKFPSRISYCVFFMDDIYWRFLLDVNGHPVITFHEEKNGIKYFKHPFAFGPTRLVSSEMPNRGTGSTDNRQSSVMVNRMCNLDNEYLKDDEVENFSFDFWMRVRYAGSSSGVTLRIDPGGDNTGPPGPPPIPS